MRLARVAGWLTTLPYRLRRDRIQIGRGLLGNGRLRIIGPGRVVLGSGVNAWSHAEVNRLITTDQGAVISVGANARLNGCTLIAARRIEIGPDCVLGSCEVRDHLPVPDRLSVDDPGPQPVVIEANVWIGGQVAILPGVRVGRNSVVGLHAVVFDDVPADCIVAGNPARVVRSLDQPGRARGEEP
jgi:carbonic anhydrase/acetyltransferase-like protein (isoleucine patch superfamily)